MSIRASLMQHACLERDTNTGRCDDPCAACDVIDAARQARNARARVNRKARHELMDSLGLVRGRDSMGRVIYE